MKIIFQDYRSRGDSAAGEGRIGNEDSTQDRSEKPDQSADAPPPALPNESGSLADRERACIDRALVRSIREGLLFDKKYWTRKSKTGSKLQPLHIPRILAREYLQHVDRRE